MQTAAVDTAQTGHFTPQNAADAARLSHLSPNRKPRALRKTSRTQGLDLQNALHRAGQLLNSDLPACDNSETRARIATAIASVAKGWQSMTEQLRVLSGKAAPGTLSPAERRAKAEAKRSTPKQSGPRISQRPAPAPAQDATSKESLS